MSDPRRPNCLGRRWEVNSRAVLEDHRLAQATNGNKRHASLDQGWIGPKTLQMDLNGMKMYEGNGLQHASLENVLG